MAPPVTPPRTSVRIHGRRGVHSRCCIHRVFFHYHPRGRHDDRPPNDDCLSCDGGRLRYNDTWRDSMLVGMSFTLIGWIARVSTYGQIGGRYREARVSALAALKIALRMYIFFSLSLWSEHVAKTSLSRCSDIRGSRPQATVTINIGIARGAGHVVDLNGQANIRHACVFLRAVDGRVQPAKSR